MFEGASNAYEIAGNLDEGSIDLSTARKSSHICYNGNSCVEVGTGNGVVFIQDSTQSESVLRDRIIVGVEAARALLIDIKNGVYDVRNE